MCGNGNIRKYLYTETGIYGNIKEYTEILREEDIIVESEQRNEGRLCGAAGATIEKALSIGGIVGGILEKDDRIICGGKGIAVTVTYRDFSV